MKRLMLALALLVPACSGSGENPFQDLAEPRDLTTLDSPIRDLAVEDAPVGDLPAPLDLGPDLAVGDLAMADLRGGDLAEPGDGGAGDDGGSPCANGKQDGDETDIDCGGSCSPCAGGKKCGSGADCQSTFCAATSKVCVASACFDQTLDGDESDVDCGGSCATHCAGGKTCGVGADCQSTFCAATSKVCVANGCLDEKQDGTETDVDCGGGTCPVCVTGKSCGGFADGARDCASGLCSTTGHKCVASACQDETQDGTETDVDCGGACTTKCADGKGCGGLANGARDCTSGICSATSHVCVSSTCLDESLDGSETDVDCGGGTCGTCVNGKTCGGLAFGARDCTSGACSATGHKCVASACADESQDNVETDVDCGGGTCGTCVNGKTCGGLAFGARDCTSGACSATGKKCVASACADESQDNLETDVDCGGGTCGTCVNGKSCGGLAFGARDCASGFCSATGKKCVASPCADESKDNAETDVDCGGGTCGTCATGRSCGGLAFGARDCTSGFCSATTKVCVADQCHDETRDNAETDTDCGGGTCATCGNGKVCGAPGDCTSGFCNGFCVTCVPAVNCASPPPNTCASATSLTVEPNPGACTSTGACDYSATTTQSCPNGCSSGACNANPPSFDGDATATSVGGPVTLDKVQNLGASAGTAPAGAIVTVTVKTTAENSLKSLTLNWTNNNFANATPVTMTLSSQAGGDDIWTADIPAQVGNTTVRFFLDGLEWDNSTHVFSPGNFFNFTYVTLSFATTVTGIGTVTSTPSGISCSTGNTGTCTSSFAPGASVTLNTGATFKRWGAGPCVAFSTSTPCNFTFNASSTQQVQFYSALAVAGGGEASAPNVAQFDPSSITVEAWAQLASTTTTAAANTHVPIVAKDNPFSGGLATGYQLGYFWNGTAFSAEFTASGGGVSIDCKSVALTAGVHHLAGVYDGFAAQLRLYVDGVQACTAAGPPPTDGSFGFLLVSNGPLQIGGPSGDPAPLGRTIDEVKLSNTPLYTTTFVPVRHPAATGTTIGLWHLDEGTGLVAADSSPTNATMTVTATNAGFVVEP